MTGIPYDEMPRYIEMYQEQLEEKEKQIKALNETALQLDKKIKSLYEALDIKNRDKARICEEKNKEIERLNNIINKLEKYINETKIEEFENTYGRRNGKVFRQAEVIICNMILDKLQELKDSDKEWTMQN